MFAFWPLWVGIANTQLTKKSNKQSKCGGRDNNAMGTLWAGIGSILVWHSECSRLAFGPFWVGIRRTNSQNEVSNKQSKCGCRDNNATGTLWAGIRSILVWHSVCHRLAFWQLWVGIRNTKPTK